MRIVWYLAAVLSTAAVAGEALPDALPLPAALATPSGTVDLPRGVFRGTITIGASATLRATTVGDFVLLGRVLVGAHDVTLERLVLRNDGEQTQPLLKLENSAQATLRGCRVLNATPGGRDSRVTALQAERCPALTLEDCLLAGNHTAVALRACANARLTGTTMLSAVGLGAQRGFSLRWWQLDHALTLDVRDCAGLVLERNTLQAPGRECPALALGGCSGWRADGNRYWGCFKLRQAPRPFDTLVRTLADWRRLTRQDAHSRLLAVDHVADPRLGAVPDPEAVFAEHANVSLKVPARRSICVAILDEQKRPVRTLLADYETFDETLLRLNWDGTDNLRRPLRRGRYTARAYSTLLDARVSWLGNTYGSWEDHVQQELRALWVAPDGTSYGLCPWDEAGKELGCYTADGRSRGCAGDLHGWSRGGGRCLTGNATYVFAAVRQGAIGSDYAHYPPDNTTWYAIRRYTRDGTPAPFAGGKGWDGSLLVLSTIDCVGGLTADEGRLYVSDTQRRQLRVFDAETLAEGAPLRCDAPGALVLDGPERVWVASGQRVLGLARDGQTVAMISGLGQAVALARDPAGRLLVVDAGPAQQVLIYDVSGQPTLVDTLGLPGGILNGTAGLVDPLKLNGPTGVGADSAGNLYVSTNREGAQLLKFSPAKKLLWRLQGLTFTDVAVADTPRDGEDVFTKQEHFKVDWRKTPVAWRYHAYTVRPGTGDPREGGRLCSTQLARIGKQRFLFCSPMYAEYLAIFRFDGLTAVPAGAVGGPRPAEEWPAGHPTAQRWLWRDLNGDGRPQPEEFAADTRPEPAASQWQVDSQGDLWRAYHTAGVLHLPCQGLDAVGNPRYDWAKAEVLPRPEPFTSLRAVAVDRTNEALYLLGETKEFGRHRADGWGPAGCVLARYDQRRDLAWCVRLDTTISGTALAATAERVYVTDVLTAGVQVFDALRGFKLGTTGPDATVAFSSGWVDFPMALQATARFAGEDAVFVEEDWCAKVMAYQCGSEVREWARQTVDWRG